MSLRQIYDPFWGGFRIAFFAFAGFQDPCTKFTVHQALKQPTSTVTGAEVICKPNFQASKTTNKIDHFKVAKSDVKDPRQKTVDSTRIRPTKSEKSKETRKATTEAQQSIKSADFLFSLWHPFSFRNIALYFTMFFRVSIRSRSYHARCPLLFQYVHFNLQYGPSEDRKHHQNYGCFFLSCYDSTSGEENPAWSTNLFFLLPEPGATNKATTCSQCLESIHVTRSTNFYRTLSLASHTRMVWCHHIPDLPPRDAPVKIWDRSLPPNLSNALSRDGMDKKEEIDVYMHIYAHIYIYIHIHNIHISIYIHIARLVLQFLLLPCSVDIAGNFE